MFVSCRPMEEEASVRMVHLGHSRPQEAGHLPPRRASCPRPLWRPWPPHWPPPWPPPPPRWARPPCRCRAGDPPCLSQPGEEPTWPSPREPGLLCRSRNQPEIPRAPSPAPPAGTSLHQIRSLGSRLAEVEVGTWGNLAVPEAGAEVEVQVEVVVEEEEEAGRCRRRLPLRSTRRTSPRRGRPWPWSRPWRWRRPRPAVPSLWSTPRSCSAWRPRDLATSWTSPWYLRSVLQVRR